MKLPLALALILTAPAFAGTSSKQVVEPAPPAEPSLWSWFAGASAGYLVDFEEPMYHLHAGVDTPWQVAGFNVALFLEAGYTEKEEDNDFLIQDPQATFPSLIAVGVDVETEIVPLTLNVKFERELASNLGFYAGAGAGVAFIDISIDGPGSSESADDTVFAFQAFTGLVYNISPSFEVYGGARYIYLDDADFGGGEVEVGDDYLLEGGIRFNF